MVRTPRGPSSARARRASARVVLAPDRATRVWTGKDVEGRCQPVILDAGHLYLNSAGYPKCLSFPDILLSACTAVGPKRSSRIDARGSDPRVSRAT